MSCNQNHSLAVGLLSESHSSSQPTLNHLSNHNPNNRAQSHPSASYHSSLPALIGHSPHPIPSKPSQASSIVHRASLSEPFFNRFNHPTQRSNSNLANQRSRSGSRTKLKPSSASASRSRPGLGPRPGMNLVRPGGDDVRVGPDRWPSTRPPNLDHHQLQLDSHPHTCPAPPSNHPPSLVASLGLVPIDYKLPRKSFHAIPLGLGLPFSHSPLNNPSHPTPPLLPRCPSSSPLPSLIHPHSTSSSSTSTTHTHLLPLSSLASHPIHNSSSSHPDLTTSDHPLLSSQAHSQPQSQSQSQSHAQAQSQSQSQSVLPKPALESTFVPAPARARLSSIHFASHTPQHNAPPHHSPRPPSVPSPSNPRPQLPPLRIHVMSFEPAGGFLAKYASPKPRLDLTPISRPRSIVPFASESRMALEIDDDDSQEILSSYLHPSARNYPSNPSLEKLRQRCQVDPHGRSESSLLWREIYESRLERALWSAEGHANFLSCSPLCTPANSHRPSRARQRACSNPVPPTFPSLTSQHSFQNATPTSHHHLGFGLSRKVRKALHPHSPGLSIRRSSSSNKLSTPPASLVAKRTKSRPSTRPPAAPPHPVSDGHSRRSSSPPVSQSFESLIPFLTPSFRRRHRRHRTKSAPRPLGGLQSGHSTQPSHFHEPMPSSHPPDQPRYRILLPSSTAGLPETDAHVAQRLKKTLNRRSQSVPNLHHIRFSHPCTDNVDHDRSSHTPSGPFSSEKHGHAIHQHSGLSLEIERQSAAHAEHHQDQQLSSGQVSPATAAVNSSLFHAMFLPSVGGTHGLARLMASQPSQDLANPQARSTFRSETRQSYHVDSLCDPRMSQLGDGLSVSTGDGLVGAMRHVRRVSSAQDWRKSECAAIEGRPGSPDEHGPSSLPLPLPALDTEPKGRLWALPRLVEPRTTAAHSALPPPPRRRQFGASTTSGSSGSGGSRAKRTTVDSVSASLGSPLAAAPAVGHVQSIPSSPPLTPTRTTTATNRARPSPIFVGPLPRAATDSLDRLRRRSLPAGPPSASPISDSVLDSARRLSGFLSIASSIRGAPAAGEGGVGEWERSGKTRAVSVGSSFHLASKRAARMSIGTGGGQGPSGSPVIDVSEGADGVRIGAQTAVEVPETQVDDGGSIAQGATGEEVSHLAHVATGEELSYLPPGVPVSSPGPLPDATSPWPGCLSPETREGGRGLLQTQLSNVSSRSGSSHSIIDLDQHIDQADLFYQPPRAPRRDLIEDYSERMSLMAGGSSMSSPTGTTSAAAAAAAHRRRRAMGGGVGSGLRLIDEILAGYGGEAGGRRSPSNRGQSRDGRTRVGSGIGQVPGIVDAYEARRSGGGVLKAKSGVEEEEDGKGTELARKKRGELFKGLGIRTEQIV